MANIRYAHWDDGLDFTGLSAWSSGTTYSADQKVHNNVAVPNRWVYKSKQNGNLNHALTDTDWWELVADGGASLPYKTITDASAGLTGGDEVRVAAIAADTAVSAAASFTQNSTTLTITGDVTGIVSVNDFIGSDALGYWMVKTIAYVDPTTTITLDQAFDYDGTISNPYTITKLNPFNVGAPASSSTAIQKINVTGTSPSAVLKISGGWDFTAEAADPDGIGETTNQTGKTVFMATNANGRHIMLDTVANSYLWLDKLRFARGARGIHISYEGSAAKNCNRLTNCEFYKCVGVWSDQSRMTILEDCADYGGQLASLAYTGALYRCKSVGNSIACAGQFYLEDCYVALSNNAFTLTGDNTLVDCRVVGTGSSNYALYSGGVVHLYNMTTMNMNGMYQINSGVVYAYNCSFNGSWANISPGARLIHHNKAQVAGVIQHEVGGTASATRIGVINATSSEGERHTESGIAWKMTVGGYSCSPTQAPYTPLDMSIGQVGIAASETATITVYVKKSHATNVSARLVCRAYQPGVAVAVTDTAADSTDWQQLSIDVTPTIDTVVEVHVEAWGTAATYVLVDDAEVSGISAQSATLDYPAWGVPQLLGDYTNTIALPAVGDVVDGVTYGGGGAEYEGTFGVPAEADVKTGVQYGEDGTEYTGTYVGGGGGGGSVIGSSIIRRAA